MCLRQRYKEREIECVYERERERELARVRGNHLRQNIQRHFLAFPVYLQSLKLPEFLTRRCLVQFGIG